MCMLLYSMVKSKDFPLAKGRRNHSAHRGVGPGADCFINRFSTNSLLYTIVPTPASIYRGAWCCQFWKLHNDCWGCFTAWLSGQVVRNRLFFSICYFVAPGEEEELYPGILPGESQGQSGLLGCYLGRTELDTTGTWLSSIRSSKLPFFFSVI